MDNDNNNNYYKYETPNDETPELVEPNVNEKYKNIINISQLSNHSIKQPKSNEFTIKCKDGIFFIVTILLWNGVCSLCICLFS